MRKLARAATPGPWRLGSQNDEAVVMTRAPLEYYWWSPGHQPYMLERDGLYPKADAAYIAACDPQTILALLDERDALRAALSKIAADYPERQGKHDLGYWYDIARDLQHFARAALAQTSKEPGRPARITHARRTTHTKRMVLAVAVLSQADLCAAQYALYLAGEREADPERKAALSRIENALHDITNHTGIDAIASDAIVGGGT